MRSTIPVSPKSILLTVVLLAGISARIMGQSITQITSFGSNPGNLNMYNYVPSGITGAAPLVIAMHGCTENATSFSQQSGWNKLANLHKFYVVYPEQQAINNSELCFNWFDTTDIRKNVGEALSIMQMIEYMKSKYSIDTNAIYVTGVSAGGEMSAVMMAVYPATFVSGAIMSGGPYGAATNATEALDAMDGLVTNSPAGWGALVRNQNPGFTGSYPHLAVFQGTADLVVDTTNTTQLIRQWTNLDHANQIIDSTNNSFQGNSNVQLTIYNDSSSVPVVYHYKITGMPHAIAVDTGSCPRQGGATATYAVEEKNFHSTYWAAQFFNLIPGPYSITGPITVNDYGAGKIYSVPSTTGSTYLWTVPPGCTIVSGQGTNSITVNFSKYSGYVQVTETQSGGCELDPAKLYVNVNTTTGINQIITKQGSVYYNSIENCIVLPDIDITAIKSIRILNVLGQVLAETNFPHESKIQLTNSITPGIYIIQVITDNAQYVTKIATR